LLLLSLLVIAVGAVIGVLGRLFVPGDQHLNWSETVLVGIVGAGLGASVLALVSGQEREPSVALVVAAVVGGAVVAAAANWAKRWWLGRSAGSGREALDERVRRLIAGGESASVEFKSTARHNLHTGTRDPKLEMVIVKTVAGFLNADGGTLLIGIDDDGEPVGLERDFAMMKKADRDGFELWLHDTLATCLGRAAVADIGVAFIEVEGRDVCCIDAPPSPQPVFVDTPKGPRIAEFWLRVGNSTRQLRTDEVLQYQAKHWG